MAAMLDAAVEVGIGAFLFGQERDDGELEEKLVAEGVERWLASRLILLLPLAFGRVLLDGCKLSDRYSVDGETYPLADDPVWVAVERRARQASREELSAIATRSSEVSAVNQYLTDHPEGADSLGELAFSHPTFVTPLPPLPGADGDACGGVASPALAFRQLLEAHHYAVTGGERGADGAHAEPPAHGELRAGALAFGAFVYPRQGTPPRVQVDYYVRHPALAAPRLLESFAGYGDTWSDAIKQTIQKFERGSLHVLIAGLLDPSSCTDQVDWEPLGDAAGAYELCLGGQLQVIGPAEPPLLGPFLDELKRALAASPPWPAEESSGAKKAHGLRVFVAHDGTQLMGYEVLVDSETWEAGQALLTQRDWRTGDESWGVRWFGLVVPARPRV